MPTLILIIGLSLALIGVPLALPPSLRSDLRIFAALWLALAVVLGAVWAFTVRRTRGGARELCASWFGGLALAGYWDNPPWPCVVPLWPWLSLGAALLGLLFLVAASDEDSLKAEEGEGLQVALPWLPPRLRLALIYAAIVMWVALVMGGRWPESLTKPLWAKFVAHFVAMGSVWLAWYLSPKRPGRWSHTNRWFGLFGLVTFGGIGSGVSPWSWGDDGCWLAYMVAVFVALIADAVWRWRESRSATP